MSVPILAAPATVSVPIYFHLDYPFYGSRKIRNELWAKGYDVGRDRVRRRYNLHPHGKGVLLSCSDHGLGEPDGSLMAAVQHAGQHLARLVL